MSLKIARRGMIDPFIVMDVMREANQLSENTDIVHLEVGQPSTPAPADVVEAAKKLLDKDRLGYTDSLGLPQLRKRIAKHYGDFYGVSVPLERMVITTGSSGGFLLAFASAFDPGDRVALAIPGYPAYRNILTALGIEPVIIETTAKERFQPTVELLESVGNIDGLIIASPSNPTGSMIDSERLKGLVDWCDENYVRMISDEIYHGISFVAPPVTVAKFSTSAIIINSFSKYFSMTGWRLGWMVTPPELIRSIECLAQNLFISPPTLSQHAAITSFDCINELERNVKSYRINREILLEELPKLGFTKIAPVDGAFYIYVDVSNFTSDSTSFCQRMLKEANVAATPGIDFDPLNGKYFIRFSFAGTESDIREACKRLSIWSY
ncbi:MAG: Aspartate aminotransferase [Alphaproteobacteria bacterium MarineAlpha12_Bin1]|jgi:aspartate/methionine/tyrosine aminotransferase|nr:MAG: Aspartate aminotransferase [Alphaproteobacteria bacterium MarineAlpha12_Bin1]|tara:strand:- start:7043 stop:8185 length:1143 start_codon:yes stop_codon:yes gene_type:complete